MKKVLVFTLSDGTTSYIDADFENFMEVVKAELNPENTDSGEREFSISCGFMDEKDLNKLPEFDGF